MFSHGLYINEFVGGKKIMLTRHGVITMELSQLARLIAEDQFANFYHEHTSYLSIVILERLFTRQRLMLSDAKELPTRSASQRIPARHADHAALPATERVTELRQRDIDDAFLTLATDRSFSEGGKRTKRKSLSCLINTRQDGKKVADYGAPGKGDSLLNYCGMAANLLEFAVDATLIEQGTCTPSTQIPILALGDDPLSTPRVSAAPAMKTEGRNDAAGVMCQEGEWSVPSANSQGHDILIARRRNSRGTSSYV